MKLKPSILVQLPAPVTYEQRAFLSLARFPGAGYIGVYREFTPEHSDKQTNALACLYDHDLNPVGNPGLVLPYGEDPRAFMWNGQPWALVKRFRADKQDWEQWLCGLVNGQRWTLTHKLAWAGKNWMPVPCDDGRLYIVRSLDPLVVLQVLPDWSCEVVIEEDAARMYPKEIGEWRGGGAARLVKAGEEEMIVGFGHRTTTKPHLCHAPFSFSIGLDDGEIENHEIETEGFGHHWLIDPTGEVNVNGQDFLLTSCASSSWWHPQTIEALLCPIPKIPN